MAYGRRGRRIAGNRRRTKRSYIRKKYYAARGRPVRLIGGGANYVARRGFRYGGTNRRQASYTAISRFIPFTRLCRFVYCETIALNPGANPSGSTTDYLHPMQVNDPLNHDDSVHQPAQYEDAMDLYDTAIVQGCKTTIRRVKVHDTSHSIYWTAVIDDLTYEKYSLNSKTYDEIEMMAGVPALKYAGDSTASRPGFNKGNFKRINFSPKKFFRISKAQLNKRGADTGTVLQPYSCGKLYTQKGDKVYSPVIKIVATAPNISTTDPSTIYLNVKMEFICLLVNANETV